jgi:hypothetical protein
MAEGIRTHAMLRGSPAELQIKRVACPRFEPSNGDQLVEAVRGLSRSDVPPFARICKTFRNRRPRLASTGSQAGEPTPIFRGRLRCAVVASCLSRRRPRVRVPSTPPFALRANGYSPFSGMPPSPSASASRHESRRPRQLQESVKKGLPVSGGSLFANRPEAADGFVCKRFASGAD